MGAYLNSKKVKSLHEQFLSENLEKQKDNLFSFDSENSHSMTSGFEIENQEYED